MRMLIFDFCRKSSQFWTVNSSWLQGPGLHGATDEHAGEVLDVSYDLSAAHAKSFQSASELCENRGMTMVGVTSVATECALVITYLLDNR